MTSFIWSVEVTGNKKLQTEQLIKALEDNGIKTGMLKYRIDTDKAVNGMMLGMEDISWISITVKGTRVKVDLRERLEIPKIVPRHIPCDIIALKDGIIRQVIATEGVEAVGAGDTVKRGQVLISGSIPLKGEKDRAKLVHAMGKVLARTWYEGEAPVITAQIERLKTGRVVNNYSLELFSWKLNLLNRKNRFRNYSVTEIRKRLSIGEDMVFPIEWVTVRYYEEKTADAAISEENARNAAAAAAYNRAAALMPEGAEIVRKSINFVKDENGVPTAKATLECIEDIGTSRRIGGN